MAPSFRIPPHVERELAFSKLIAKGARGRPAKRVQEWVSIHGFRTPVDSDFGSATEHAVVAFQESRKLKPTGRVDKATWTLLVEPLARAVGPVPLPPGASGARAVLAVARHHLKEHPIEVGGENCGPWVRAYMNGNEGRDWKWCAGFVTFVLRQAYALIGQPPPIKGSFSCDSLAAQARDRSLFVSEAEMKKKSPNWSGLGDSMIFLVRRTPMDWIHTGFAFAFEDQGFTTIEGNTNSEGGRDGYEVCSQSRGFGKKDFISLP